MPGLADRPLRELLDEVAAATPAPGGGCSIAWTCGLAAGLVAMSASITAARADDPERLPEIAARSRDLQAAALELGERELHAYDPVLTALRLPGTDPARASRLRAALDQAAQTPADLARVAAELTALAEEAAGAAGPHVRGDAVAGALLAEAACQAAARLARINLAELPRDERSDELDALTMRSAQTRARLT